MEITSNIRMDDHRAFTRHVWYSGARGSWKWFLLIFLGVVAVVALMDVRAGIRLDTPTMLVAMVILSGYLALAQRRIRPIADGTALGVRTFRIAKDGLCERSRHYDSLTRWSGVRAVDETADYIFVFIDNCEAHIIPKRAFASDEHAHSFAAELRTKSRQANASCGAHGGVECDSAADTATA